MNKSLVPASNHGPPFWEQTNAFAENDIKHKAQKKKKKKNS